MNLPLTDGSAAIKTSETFMFLGFFSGVQCHLKGFWLSFFISIPLLFHFALSIFRLWFSLWLFMIVLGLQNCELESPKSLCRDVTVHAFFIRDIHGRNHILNREHKLGGILHTTYLVCRMKQRGMM